MEKYPKYIVQDIIPSQDGPMILFRPSDPNQEGLKVEKGKEYIVGASPTEPDPVPEFNQ